MGCKRTVCNISVLRRGFKVWCQTACHQFSQPGWNAQGSARINVVLNDYRLLVLGAHRSGEARQLDSSEAVMPTTYKLIVNTQLYEHVLGRSVRAPKVELSLRHLHAVFHSTRFDYTIPALLILSHSFGDSYNKSLSIRLITVDSVFILREWCCG